MESVADHQDIDHTLLYDLGGLIMKVRDLTSNFTFLTTLGDSNF